MATKVHNHVRSRDEKKKKKKKKKNSLEWIIISAYTKFDGHFSIFLKILS